MRKDDNSELCVIIKIALTHLVISDPCQNKSLYFENDTKQFLSIKNIIYKQDLNLAFYLCKKNLIIYVFKMIGSPCGLERVRAFRQAYCTSDRVLF